MSGGVVCWIWAVLPLPHSSAPKSLAVCGFSESFPQEQLWHFYHPCAPVNVAEVPRALSCFSLAIKIKEGLGSPCAAAGAAVLVCLTHAGSFSFACAVSLWQVCSSSLQCCCWWAEQKVRAGLAGEVEQAILLEAPKVWQSCSWAGDVHQWSSDNQLQGWGPQLEQAMLLCFTFSAKIEQSSKTNFLKSDQSLKSDFCSSASNYSICSDYLVWRASWLIHFLYLD